MTERISPGILATCCLPWNENCELDVPIFRREIAGQLAAGVEHLYLFGTAGEGYAVTNAQFEGAARVFVEATQGRTRLRQLGVVGLSLPQVQERIELGRSLGVDSFQISFPSWGRMNDRELDDFFDGTCGRYPACSFLFYNVPRGLRLLTSVEVGTLARRHPNLTAVKWAVALEDDELRQVVRHAPDVGHFLGDISYLQASLMDLRCGLLTSMTSTNPRLMTKVFDLGQQRNNDAQLRQRLAEAMRHRDILRSLEMGGGHMDGAFDKMFCRLRQPEFPLRLLPPWQGASEAAFQQYRDRLAAELPEWLPQ